MAVVAGVLLDHVDENPSEGHGVPCPLGPLIEGASGGELPGMVPLTAKGGEAGVGIHVSRQVKVTIRIGIRVVERRRVLARQGAAKPAALDLGHVPDESEQGELRGRDSQLRQLGRAEAVALPHQRGAVVVEEGGQQVPLVADKRRIGPCHGLRHVAQRTGWKDRVVTEIALPYFFARPSAEPPWPGVVVIHEGNGISPQLLRICQRFAGQGCATIAPDLFFRAGGTEAASFATLMGGLDRDRTLGDIAWAADQIRAMGAGSVGVTGFCMGGLWTYRAAVRCSGFDAAVGFYSARISAELGQPACPTLLFFGDSDEYIPADQIEKVVAHHPETVVYAGAGHGFMRDGSSSFDEPAATDAWSRTLAFFSQHLR